jgi:hypothetical protein
MTSLDGWLKQATRRLSADSIARVQTEIREHYESAREAAMSSGATQEEADREALAALGDPRVANCRYVEVLLTSQEARMLRQSNWEARIVCSRPFVGWTRRLAPLAAALAVANFFVSGETPLACALLVAAVGMAFIFLAPFLPIYTPFRSRFFRYVKYVALFAAVILPLGPKALQWSWLLVSCLWPVVWIEMTRNSIRRKLPVAEWPKQLYL